MVKHTADIDKKHIRDVIVCNKAQCLECGEVLESEHRHDYRTCKCGNLMVDGGKDYIRRGYRDAAKIKDLSVERTEPVGCSISEYNKKCWRCESENRT